jgi:hypothetical protein
MLDDAIRSNIGRVVAFVLTPILLPVTTIVANWLQDAAGLDLNGGDLAAYLVAIAVGVALAAFQWLRNRGEWERATMEVHKLYDAGRAEFEANQGVEEPPTSVPPGIEGSASP